MQLAGEQVDRLALEVFVAAGCETGFACFGVLVAFDPVPLALRSAGLFVGEDEQVFRVAAGNVLPHTHALLLVGPAVIGDHLDGDHAAQFGHGAAGEVGFACGILAPPGLGAGLVPAQHVDEQVHKVEGGEVLFEGREV